MKCICKRIFLMASKRNQVLTCLVALSLISIYIMRKMDWSSNLKIIERSSLAPVIFNEYVVNTTGCKIPLLNPYHASFKPFLMNYSYEHARLCTTKPLLILDNQVLRLNYKETKKMKKLKCTYISIRRSTDDRISYGSEIYIDKDIGAWISDEFIRAQCYQSGDIIYRDYFPSIIRKTSVERRCKSALQRRQGETQVSVVLLGIDSVSTNQYRRHFEGTHAFIKDNLQYVQLYGYNKIGLNTFPNILPILTGKTETEYNVDFSETPLDFLPFIWKNFSRNGYRTLIAEDYPSITGFNYCKMGFKIQPTDYYLRPFSIAADKLKMIHTIKKLNCVPHIADSSVILKWTEDFFDKFKDDPLFAYVYLTRLTHGDYNGAALYDTPILHSLKRLYSKGHLNKTIVFFFSDHGYRFGGVRRTAMGSIEEKLPFFLIIVPKWFPTEYPVFYKNLVLNEKRLITSYDMHATLIDILNSFKSVKNFSSDEHSVSLLSPISTMRTCDTVHIDAMFCSCAERREISIQELRVKKAAKLVVDYINILTSKYRRKCVKYEFFTILNAASQRFFTDIGQKNESYVVTLQITIAVAPNNAIFEGIVVVDEPDQKYVVRPIIDRINIYGNQSDCVDIAHLKPLCSCKR